MASHWQMCFQEESTPFQIGIRDLHDDVIYYILIIGFIVITMVLCTLKGKGYNIASFTNNHNSFLELVWTLLAAGILIFIAVPSFKLLYSDTIESINPLVTLNIQGSQWFWTYSINDIIDIEFTSYPKLIEDLIPGEIAGLEVDNKIVLPVLTPIRLLITANDVIHSWAMPALGVKIDAIPGRVNYGFIYILKPGVYYGQCSELCGLGHSSMPIAIEAVSSINYYNWLFTQGVEISFNELVKFISYVSL